MKLLSLFFSCFIMNEFIDPKTAQFIELNFQDEERFFESEIIYITNGSIFADTITIPIERKMSQDLFESIEFYENELLYYIHNEMDNNTYTNLPYICQREINSGSYNLLQENYKDDRMLLKADMNTAKLFHLHSRETIARESITIPGNFKFKFYANRAYFGPHKISANIVDLRLHVVEIHYAAAAINYSSYSSSSSIYVTPITPGFDELYQHQVVNTVHRGKLQLLFDLHTCALHLEASGLTNVEYHAKLPAQIVVRVHELDFTFILFGSGQFRIMGASASASAIDDLLSRIKSIYTYILLYPYISSETVVLQLHPLYVPINLVKLAESCSTDMNVSYEPELFPAIALKHWKPAHVNVFSTGKVVVLGKDASTILGQVEDFLSIALLTL